LIQANVTSVVCFCDDADVQSALMQNATAQQYRPEWILSTYIDADVDNSFQKAPPDQSSHVIGLSFRNMWLPREYMPGYWSIKDAHPEFDPSAAEAYDLAARYSSLLLLASGIQTAGPNLTAKTFETGLQATTFPNPGAEGAPYYQAWVGFPNGDHTMMHDATMYWFSPSDRGTMDPTNPGAVCYVDRGKRYELDAWRPQQPAFHSGSCRP
ncbi:MAG: hypothetical protein LC663_01270, partial [Actinobacteria bacterium]|nr:hypothetical protein [Actinomycetota bacterium]